MPAPSRGAAVLLAFGLGGIAAAWWVLSPHGTVTGTGLRDGLAPVDFAARAATRNGGGGSGGGGTASTGPCVGLANFPAERLPVEELLVDANYTKKGYFRELRRRFKIESGRQNRSMPRPLCLEARNGAEILPPSCLEDAGYRWVVIVGASLSREVGWSIARHVFDPPPASSSPSPSPSRTPGNDPYCQPYAFVDSDAGLPRSTFGGAASPDWSYATFQRVASAGSWPSFVCDEGLAKGSLASWGRGGAGATGKPPCRVRQPARPPKGYYIPTTGFAFARSERECCGEAGSSRFWQELVQLDDPVRFAGSRKQPGKEHHHTLIQRLVAHLARNCPCRGLVWVGIGAHELKHGRPWFQDPSKVDYGNRKWLKEPEERWYRDNGLAWLYPFGRELGMRRLLRNVTSAVRGTGVRVVVADAVAPEPMLMHAAPPKLWSDTEQFGPTTSLSRLFHEVDARVAAEANVSLVPYYDASIRYAGLQCDGLHFGKSDGGTYGCHGFTAVTDVVLQALLNDVCGGGRKVSLGC